MGEFGGWANISKFASFIKKSDTVLDFGCGGGFLLKNLECARKIGVEINLSAGETAKNNGLEVFTRVKDIIDDNLVDVLISENALEHTHYPLNELTALYQKLKPGGKAVFVVPCENISFGYEVNSIDQHLYSWSPMSIGNLFTLAGFHVIESHPYIHKWPPRYQMIAKIGGRKLFDLAATIYGHINRKWFQIRIIAHKEI